MRYGVVYHCPEKETDRGGQRCFFQPHASMSRPPRARTPPHHGLAAAPASATRPLQFSRPNPRSATLSRTPSYSSPSGGPSRPQRSELRGRTTDDAQTPHRSSTASSDNHRDSIPTSRSDGSTQHRSHNHSRPRPSRNPSGYTDEGNETTPTSLNSVMSAFKDAGTRRRAMTNGSDDVDYQRQRQEEFEAERVRQQRIQKKMIKRKGNARAGDIDGELSPTLPLRYSPPHLIASRPRPNQRWMAIHDRTRCKNAPVNYSYDFHNCHLVQQCRSCSPAPRRICRGHRHEIFQTYQAHFIPSPQGIRRQCVISHVLYWSVLTCVSSGN